MSGARVVCAACSTPLILVWRDGEDLEYKVLDQRLKGSAVLFQRDREDADRVHKVVIACQAKGCRGTPQFRTDKMLALVDALGERHASGSPLDVRL